MSQILSNIEIHTYAIIDSARVSDELNTARKLQTNFASLYMGQSEELLSSVAPYLFSYQTESEFGKWLFEKGWGNSWGLFVETSVSLEDLRKHFRKFLIVKTEGGEQLYFRFYDPRVLRIFLPTCDAAQLVEFFGPLQQFICEDEDPAFALILSFDGRQLVTERVAAGTIFSSVKAVPNVDVLPATNNDMNNVQEKKKPPRRFFYE